MSLKKVRKWVFLFSILFVCSIAFADTSTIQRVQFEPLSGGLSFNTVTTGTGWVTCPSVEMRGRKRVCILNTSSTNNVYLTNISGSTVKGTLYPKERAFFASSSDLHIYVSANSVIQVEVWEIR